MKRWLLAAASCLLALSCARPPSPPQAVVFEGDCAACTASVVTALQRDADRDWQIRVVRRDLRTALQGTDLFVVPGGNEDIEDTWQRFSEVDRRAVDAFVRGGGKYLGICLGAYLAGAFQVKEQLVGWGWLEGVRAYSGPLQGTVMEALVKTRWHVAGRVQPRFMYFSEGTSFGDTAPENAVVLASYANGEIAALVQPVGQGAVGAIGPHPEADADWYDAPSMKDADGYDADLLHHLLDALLEGTTSRG